MDELKKYINKKVMIMVYDKYNELNDTFTDTFTKTDYEFYSDLHKIKKIDDSEEYTIIQLIQEY